MSEIQDGGLKMTEEVRCSFTRCDYNRRDKDQSGFCTKTTISLDFHGQCTEVAKYSIGCTRCSGRELVSVPMPEYE